MTHSEKLDMLSHELHSCGQHAKSQQHLVHRSYKEDGSVLTEVDVEISTRILRCISTLFPEANIISEEMLTPWKEDAPWTFVLDPIDGTDGYSQGLSAWCVALGILDSNRKPVGCMISAPRWGIGTDDLFVRLDPGGKLFVNGLPFEISGNKDFPHQITMGSGGPRHMDFSRFPGHIRIFGSSIIHLISVVLFPYFQGCVNQPCYIWDIAAAHALLLYAGMDIEYADQTPFEYDDNFVIKRERFKGPVYVGTSACRSILKEILPVNRSQ